MFHSYYHLNFGSQMTNLYRGAPSLRILSGSGAGLREKAVPGVTGGGVQWERGSAEPALGYSPSQEERDWVEAASFKTKAKPNKFPD